MMEPPPDSSLVRFQTSITAKTKSIIISINIKTNWSTMSMAIGMQQEWYKWKFIQF